MKRQELMGGKVEERLKGKGKEKIDTDFVGSLDEYLNCLVCLQWFCKPVTTHCGHNFCSDCFKYWIHIQGKRSCMKCRKELHPKMISTHLRINKSLYHAISVSKNISSFTCIVDHEDGESKLERAQEVLNHDDTTEMRFVTVPTDHFGPIPAENDPKRNTGVLVGETWQTRRECVQWGVHCHRTTRIVGQIGYGAQSVVLSGGYIDDEDHGDWFIYTGSGGKDFSQNRWTKEKSFDQDFSRHNDALTVSCLKGYPVRVVRSSNDKLSLFSPDFGYRYDGVYRIEKCWRLLGAEGLFTCRYLFVRCDNEPAPWTRDEHGDRPRMLPVVDELIRAFAMNLIERTESPSWDFDEEDGRWKWRKPPPPTRTKIAGSKRARDVIPLFARNKWKHVLKELHCSICNQLMSSPVTTSCGHTFCKACLEGAVLAGKAFQRRKNVIKCPTCRTNIYDWLEHIEVNRDMKALIEFLRCKAEETDTKAEAKAQEEASTTGSQEFPHV